MTAKEKTCLTELAKQVDDLIDGIEIYKRELKEARFKLLVLTNDLESIRALDLPNLSATTRFILKKLGYNTLADIKKDGLEKISEKIYGSQETLMHREEDKILNEVEIVLGMVDEIKKK